MEFENFLGRVQVELDRLNNAGHPQKQDIQRFKRVLTMSRESVRALLEGVPSVTRVYLVLQELGLYTHFRRVDHFTKLNLSGSFSNEEMIRFVNESGQQCQNAHLNLIQFTRSQVAKVGKFDGIIGPVCNSLGIVFQDHIQHKYDPNSPVQTNFLEHGNREFLPLLAGTPVEKIPGPFFETELNEFMFPKLN